MPDPLLPLRFLLLVFAGLLNCEQAGVVEYLREENRVLREQMDKRRLRLTNGQRARLAAKAKALGRSAYAERFVQSVKRECLDRMILLGARHLLRALKEFVAQYHLERPHQGLGNRLLTPRADKPVGDAAVADERLGGLLRSYRRSA